MSARSSFGCALITGASSGIGQAFAEVLPRTTDLLLTGRDRARLEALAGRLARSGRRVDAVVADLATDQGRHAVIEQAEVAGIDLLVNNAGIGLLGRVIDHAPEAERATVELNVTTPLVLTRALLPGMLERARAARRRAGVVFVSSEAAFAPVPYFASYAASKAFDLVFAESIAEELRAEPVDVLALCPGATRTAFGRRAGFSTNSLPGAADPRDVAREGLQALGRHRVVVPGLARRAAFAPITIPRRLAALGIGTMMDLVMRWQNQPRDPAEDATAPSAPPARPPRA